jgi:endonuclease/exonuclease/phosphatase family metal-dependent hydrolase
VSKSLRHPHRRLRELCLLAVLIAATACATGSRLAPAAVPFSHASTGITWMTSHDTGDAPLLASWRRAVGEPVVLRQATTSNHNGGLVVVSWNIALGSGDVASLFRSVQREHPGRHVVLLLQEAFRGGPEVPHSPEHGEFARQIRGVSDREIDDVAKALGLSLVYIPSMRNGAPGLSDEDRGNAILSTLPLDDVVAIELPFERQRRVAVAATVRGRAASGEPWQLRVVSAHLDNMAGASRAWIGAEYARQRQARGLRDALSGSESLVLAGDFNTWFGFKDAAYRETARAFPQTKVSDTRRTFMGLLRLDHVFYRLPDGWRASVRRGESSLGSDHFPLITTVEF